MATITSELLEKAEFGKFQKENQEALATLDKEKRNLRIKRKLKEANARAKQVKVKFDDTRGLSTDRQRTATITLGNRVQPVEAWFTYKPGKIHVSGIIPKEHKQSNENPFTLTLEELGAKVKNKILNTGQIRQVMGALKKRYPKANVVEGTRVTGARAKLGGSIHQRIPLKGKKLGLLGLGLSLGEAIKAGNAAYKAKEEGKM